MNIAGYSITVPTGFVSGDINTLWGILRFIISLLVFGGVVLALVFLIIGGIKLITSLGDKQATASAKATITYALIGLLLLLGSFFILNLIQSFFNVSVGLPRNTFNPPASRGIPGNGNLMN